MRERIQCTSVDEAPTIEEVRAARRRLGEAVRRTPVWPWRDVEELGDTLPVLKLELLQAAGSFKPRSALLHAWALDEDARARGVTAVSAGNHAMAVGYAARTVGTTAKVVMPRRSSPLRVNRCRDYGAEVVLVEDVHEAFATVERIVAEEGRTFVHPFEGKTVAIGTGTVGLELLEDAPDLDAVIVPIGGGGLCAGIAAVVKQMRPQCQVFGVEPEGADSMHRSFARGEPQSIEAVRTIADSLGAPHCEPYAFAMCRRYVDDLVKVDDDALCIAMARLFYGAKLAVEPAGAAATAALFGPLRERLAGKRVGVIVCGANIDAATFAQHLARGDQLLSASGSSAGSAGSRVVT
jgi:threonine dehydratase